MGVRLDSQGNEYPSMGDALLRVIREAAVLAPLWVPVFGGVGWVVVEGHDWIKQSNEELHDHLEKVESHLVAVDSRLTIVDRNQAVTNEYLTDHTRTINEAKAGETVIRQDIATIKGHIAADESHWTTVESMLTAIVNKMIPERRAGGERSIAPTSSEGK